MKLIKYTLLKNGSVPDYIIDGGYFPKSNSNNSPQDFDLVGLTNDNSKTGFSDKADFESYVKSFTPDSYTDIDGTTIYLQYSLNFVWGKLNT